MMSVDMQHFLDEKGSTHQVPRQAKELADHFGTIVTAVTLDFTGRAIEVTGVSCRNSDSPHCTGAIIGKLGENSGRIEWHCNECKDAGFISGWQGTLWDCCDHAQA